MAGVTATLLGDLEARREMGKVGTQSDLHLHDFKEADRDVTTLVPMRYPDQLKGLSYAVCGADSAVLVIDAMNAQVGEQILALDAAGVDHGIIVLENYLQPEQVQPLLKGTTLDAWPMQTEADWPAVRAHVATAPARTGADQEVRVPIDHHFDVKGVGAVILGVVERGTLRKGDTLYAWPDQVICPVRSIQCHDVDVPEAVPGDRVGLALRNTKADQLDRGMVLAPADAPLQARKSGDEVSFTMRRSPFAKQALGDGSVVHLGLGMQFVPVRLQGTLPDPGEEGQVTGILEKGLVVATADHGVLWHVDSAPQRVLGAARF